MRGTVVGSYWIPLPVPVPKGPPAAIHWHGSYASVCHHGSDLKYDVSSEPTQLPSALATGIGYRPPRTFQASVSEADSVVAWPSFAFDSCFLLWILSLTQIAFTSEIRFCQNPQKIYLNHPKWLLAPQIFSLALHHWLLLHHCCFDNKMFYHEILLACRTEAQNLAAREHRLLSQILVARKHEALTLVARKHTAATQGQRGPTLSKVHQYFHRLRPSNLHSVQFQLHDAAGSSGSEGLILVSVRDATGELQRRGTLMAATHDAAGKAQRRGALMTALAVLK